MTEVVDLLVRWLGIFATAVGLPAVVLWVLHDRRTGRSTQRKAEADADREEGMVAPDVRRSSVVSLEAEISALSSSFETDRKVKQQTIEWLTTQLTAERQQSALKDQRIRELEKKVGTMTKTLDNLRDELARVTEDLKDLRTPHSHESDEVS